MKIFVSYAHEDSEDVLEVVQALNVHEVWIDNKLNVGQEWWNEIERQIAACHCFLFVMSPESMGSEYCLKEVEVARRLQKPIAPIMLRQMDIPRDLSDLQMINVTEGMTAANIVRLLNGLFEIERLVFNPLRPGKGKNAHATKLAISELCFATTSERKKQQYEYFLGVPLQTMPLQLFDIQHVDAGEVVMDKVKKAFEILHKPVFVEQSAMAVRAWGGLPGGLTSAFMTPLGLSNFCKMLHPFEDKHAEALSVIAFTDGYLYRKFVGVLSGTIADQPRGRSMGWNSIFIPEGFSVTLAELHEEEYLSISSRKRALVEFMRFLQDTYEITVS
jgi:non-canonical purine NTP pyrophosphatase (RdgB/HAM1 family)